MAGPADADYEPLYRRGERLFGPPSRAVTALFATLPAPTTVLDLGCGQGRHALFAARLGHVVTAVDHAPTGIAQLLADARDLPVTGVVADVRAFRSRRRFGVVLLVRVLHLLPSESDRRALVQRLSRLTRKGGFVLIENSARLRGASALAPGDWVVRRMTADVVVAERR